MCLVAKVSCQAGRYTQVLVEEVRIKIGTEVCLVIICALQDTFLVEVTEHDGILERIRTTTYVDTVILHVGSTIVNIKVIVVWVHWVCTILELSQFFIRILDSLSYVLAHLII